MAPPWECLSEDVALQEVCDYVRTMHRLAMDFFRSRWVALDCETITDGGYYYPWPCFFSMWDFFWRDKAEIATWCWSHGELPVCVLTTVAIVMLMLKQADLWHEASSLFSLLSHVGIVSFMGWPSVYQTPWFVRLAPDAARDQYVPGGSGRWDEPVAPYSLSGGPAGGDGFFDPLASEVLRPLALALKEAWPSIRDDYAASQASEQSRSLLAPRKASAWMRYVPGETGWKGSSGHTWWDGGRAGMGASVRLWGGNGYNDTHWNEDRCSSTFPTLCGILRTLLPRTARPVPKYVTDTAGRWEFLSTYTLHPGGSQALHHDPTRCFWQICLAGCGDAFIQVGRAVHRYVEGEMIAFDATFDHSVWNSHRAKASRVVLHASMHYCQGSYAE